MTATQRWLVSLVVALLVAATSLLAGRLVPAPPPSALPPAPQTPSVSPTPSPTPASRRPMPKPTPSFRTIRIAATAPGNELFGVEATDCPTCVSGSRVKYVGQGHGIVVPLRDIPRAGRRTLTIYYESDGPRPLQVAVADSPAVTLTVPGKDSWMVPARVDLTVQIPAGDSSIKLFHPDQPAPDLDQIVVR
jgi:hypothetical protein